MTATSTSTTITRNSRLKVARRLASTNHQKRPNQRRVVAKREVGMDFPQQIEQRSRAA